MRLARAAPCMSAALLCLLSACSILTGEQNIPPPWDSNAAPSEPVLPPGANHFAPSPSFLKLDGAIANPTGYPVPRPDPEPAPDASALAAPPPSPAAAEAAAPVPLSITEALPPAAAANPPLAPPAPAPMPAAATMPGQVADADQTAGTEVGARPAPALPLIAENRMQAPAPEPRSAPQSTRVIGVLPPADATPALAPAAAPPALPDGFVVGPGDLVTITVFGRPELTVNANVSDDGRVPMALIGNVKIGGLSPVQASDRIAAALRDGQYLLDPKVSVVFNEYRSRQISVLGEVKSPGRFPVNTRLTVLDAIALAGGIDVLGSQSALILRPQGKIVTRYEVDIDDLLDAGVGQEYFDVQGGDTVIVPRAEVFYIYGEVKQPNMYKLRPGMTVVQALSLGGGLTDKGSDHRVEIRRRSADGKLVHESASLSDVLEPDDVVYVHERLF